MRCLWSWLSISCVALLPFVPAAELQWSLESTTSSTSTTLVDALSADPDYTALIRLLQRARLIPTLNRLNGSTFWAPTNDAIFHHAESNPLWRHALSDGDFFVTDNVHEKLRQELFYHLLNYTFSDSPTDSAVRQHKTLLFPRTVQPPSDEPPPLPPWMPTPGGTLGGEPQRVRTTSQEESLWVGVDAFGKHGAQVVKDRVDAGNGILFGISAVLDVPPDLATLVSLHSSISYFSKIVTPEIRDFLNNTHKLTLFLPTNNAWQALHPLERLYLESAFASEDLNRILNMHAVVGESVMWSDSFRSKTNLSTIDGTNLEIVKRDSGITVSRGKLTYPDIYASNGVLHLVDSLLIPNGTLQLTAEKYLLALNCSSFVSLLHSVDLAFLVNNTETKYTILAPRDDILSVFGEGDLPPRGSDELKTLLQYHFLPGRWVPKKLKDGMLVETALQEPGLDGGGQVLNIGVHEDSKKPKSWKSISFGSAGVIDDPVELNNTIIYFISRPLVPPTDPLQTALPVLDLSSFLAAVFSTSLADALKTIVRTTLLIPHNSAFQRVGGLVSEHLLSASAKMDLEKVILHHVIDGVEYASGLQNGSQRSYPTLEGSDVQFDRRANGLIFLSGSGGWAGMLTELHPKNRLTSTGVVHELSDLLIPRSLELTVGKLMKAAKGSTMGSLVVRAGMDWILNGTAPPDDSPWADEGLSGVGWTLLCPTDNAFKEVNLTRLYADVDSIRDVVRQHLIPSPKADDFGFFGEPNFSNNDKPLPFDDGATFTTLLGTTSSYGDVVFKRMEHAGGSGYVVGIKGARGTNGKTDWARVVSWGRSTTGDGTGGVIQINRLLVPYQPSWWRALGAPVAVGVVGILAICGFFYVVRVVWRRDTTEATYEPVGGFRGDEEDS